MPSSKRKCHLIVDSCCDLPYEIIEQADIELINFPYFMNDGEHFDDLGRSMTPRQFYDAMRKGETPHTAQVPLPVFDECFRRALSSGVPTVYLCFTSGLSGSYDTATRIASELAAEYPEGELHVVDTKLASVAQGMLVLAAIHQLDRGLTAAELAEWAQEMLYHVQASFTLDGLEDLRRGGRIPDMAAYAGAKLDIKPTLGFDLDGMLTLTGVNRGRKKSLKALVDFVENNLDTINEQDSIIVASADAEKDADYVAEKIQKLVPRTVIVRCNVGPVIGSHVGPGMVAVVYIGSDRREKISLADRIANAARARKSDK